MKIQFIFLVVCVVASIALPQPDHSFKSEQREDDEQQELENTNRGSAIVHGEQIDFQDENLSEKTNLSNDTVTEINKCKNWIWRRHNRRYWLRRGEQSRRDRHSTELSNEDRRNALVGQESQTLSPYESPDTEAAHHRHHHRHHHHHHHHKNRTTTTPPPTTTTTSTLQLSELEEVARNRHLTPN